MEKIYRLTAMSYHHGQVALTLTEIIVIPPEEIERARMEAELEPVVVEEDVDDIGEQLGKLEFKPAQAKTDTQRVVEEITDEYLKIMKRELPSIFDGSMGGGPRVRMVPPAISPLPDVLNIRVTYKEYEALGSPAILARLRMTLEP